MKLSLILVTLLAATPAFATSPAGNVLATGSGHSCALSGAGTVQCWGSNITGQLGDGTTTDRKAPRTVVGITTATQVSSNGGVHTCAVLVDGTVQCWGKNDYGQLGIGGNSFGYSTRPTGVPGITSAVSVSAGRYHTCAVLASGAVQCWGHNNNGQLGDGTTVSSTLPVTVSGIGNAREVSAGHVHTCAVLTTGGIQCWGNNAAGQLGNNTKAGSSVPVSVSGMSDAKQVAVGSAFTCAVRNDGSVQCWGDNGLGQLGIGTVTGATFKTPVAVTSVVGATAISAHLHSACAVTNLGTVQCWGNNGNGQLGRGTRAGGPTPQPVNNLANATSVSAGNSFTCALLANGNVQCWGANASGQLGDGTSIESTVPVTVAGLILITDAEKVFAWAERTYPSIFSPSGSTTQSIAGYLYRSYSSGHFLAVNDSGTTHLYYVGPLGNNSMLDLGLLSGWVSQSGL